MSTVYVLECLDGKYYIGRTNDVRVRIAQHFSIGGAMWTDKHKPVKTVMEVKSDDPSDEDIWTKVYMKKYGVENVRGGSYTTDYLPYQTVTSLTRQLNAMDGCFACGKPDHQTDSCTDRKYKPTFYSTGSSGWTPKKSSSQKIKLTINPPTEAALEDNTQIKAHVVVEDYVQEVVPEVIENTPVVQTAPKFRPSCDRCGAYNHYTNTCTKKICGNCGGEHTIAECTKDIYDSMLPTSDASYTNRCTLF